MELSGRSNVSSELITSTFQRGNTPLLVPTRSVEEMHASPLGRCMVGASYVVWCAAPDLQGSILWGTLDAATIRDLLVVGEFMRHPTISRSRRSLTDCGPVEHIEPESLLAFSSRSASNEPWSTTLKRQAFVVPDGLPGMMMAGSLTSTGAEHPLRIVRDLEAAFAVVAHPMVRAAHAAASAIVADVRGIAVVLTRMRIYLRRALDHATIESSADALRMSSRTLQRQLRQLGTSFSDELRKARVATAELLLVNTDLKIEAIATQVGFGTASRMSVYLRRELDVTATKLRANRRTIRGKR